MKDTTINLSKSISNYKYIDICAVAKPSADLSYPLRTTIPIYSAIGSNSQLNILSFSTNNTPYLHEATVELVDGDKLKCNSGIRVGFDTTIYSTSSQIHIMSIFTHD